MIILLSYYKIKAKAKENKHYTKLNNYLLILMMTDYVFTYIGINHLGVIAEANPLLVTFFELPFSISFFLRLIYGVFLVLLSKFLYLKRYKHYDKFMFFALGVNSIITLMHIRWVTLAYIGII